MSVDDGLKSMVKERYGRAVLRAQGGETPATAAGCCASCASSA